MAKAIELAAELEKLAAHYRSLGDAEVDRFTFYSYQTSKEDFLKAAAQMPKPFSKEYKGDDFLLVYEVPGLHWEVYVKRNRVCRLIRPAQEAIYDCEPLLSREEESSLGVDAAIVEIHSILDDDAARAEVQL